MLDDVREKIKSLESRVAELEQDLASANAEIHVLRDSHNAHEPIPFGSINLDHLFTSKQKQTS